MMSKFIGIKAVGFDLDDTLVMTEPKAFETENKVLVRMGHPPMSREVHLSTWGQPLDEAVELRAPGVNSQEFMKVFAEEFEKRLKRDDMDLLTESASSTLEYLSSKGYYLFILTNRDGFETVHLTRGGHPISVHIAPEDVYHRDNVDKPKPDAAAFNWLIARGYKPEECVFVGDSLIDGQAANAAGLKFIATLESGIRADDYFKDIKVSAVINSFGDLKSLL